MGSIHGVSVHGFSKLPDSIAMCIIFNADRAGLKMYQHLWLYALGMLNRYWSSVNVDVLSTVIMFMKFNISLYRKRGK
jgi:hypothetical protein